MDRRLPRVANRRTIAALGDPQSMNGETRGVRNFLVDFGRAVLRVHRDGVREVFDRAACMTSTISYPRQTILMYLGGAQRARCQTCLRRGRNRAAALQRDTIL